MDNPVIIAVFLVAAAQALTILLTVRREKDIKELRELFNEQRLHIIELRAWLAGRNTAQLSRIKSDRGPTSEPIGHDIKASEPAIAPKDVPATIQLRTIGNEVAQSGRPDLGGSHPAGQEQWPVEDLQRFVARLKEGILAEPAQPKTPEPAISPKDLAGTTRPSTTGDELERATKAINWLKEDADKAREMGTHLPGTSAEKKTG